MLPHRHGLCGELIETVSAKVGTRWVMVRLVCGEVAERSNAADCKSVGLAPSEVRILPSPPISVGGSAPVAVTVRSGNDDGSDLWCGSNSVVESQPSKLLVAGSIPVSRSSFVVAPVGDEWRNWSRGPEEHWWLSVGARSARAD